MNEAALRGLAEDWRLKGRRAVVVSVDQAQGSAPREAGARLLVAEDGALAGTLGGGHLELQAIAAAREALQRNEPLSVRVERFALGPSLGQCCGGAMVLRHAPLDAAALAAWPEPAVRFVLQLHGAGHVGAALVRALADIDCRIQWVDGREAVFPTDLPAHVQPLRSDAPEDEVADAPAGAAVLVMTHSHDLDLRIVQAALQRGDLGYVGLIGSATKRARFERRLQARGLDTGRLVCPVGVPGLEGKEPAVIALGVAVQLLQRFSPACPPST
ncbi:xanthine dehydrogenase accessory protein XdhC [Aquabacterium sp. J223]|uniref:xanthine dehydrogenase accessory protein XdhC n=1 Tax=Aquabacterium sp. J223 TaxID=2898431 RepID=UPI0021AE2013|nr:xanthine dehydrogenase accessory protein XdhC [Aquabacterium sp. J223]UUX95532.1 xanthine dehydrogenase accessory protein XdhC [Aquabacterium sp. J223]